MHQSIETPTLQFPEKGGEFDINPGQKASRPPPPEAEMEIKFPYTWVRNFKQSNIYYGKKIQMFCVGFVKFAF